MTKFLKNISVESEGHIQFKTIDGTNAGKIDQDGNDLVLTNAVGDVLLGDGSSDVYIGNGSNNVDILFEQSGNIKADDSASSVTLTLGSSNTSLNIISPTISGNLNIGTTSINNKLTFTGNDGYILFDREPSNYDGTTSIPLLKVDQAGTEKTILERISANGGILLGADDTIMIAGGDTRNVLRTNLNETAENVVIASEAGFVAYGFPGNDTSWANRNEFKFRSDSSTASENGLYIGDGGSAQLVDLSRNLTASTLTTSGNIKAMSGGNIYVYDDDDDTRIHVNASSNSTEGVFRVSNGANFGLIARGISNNPRLGAYHNGTLDIYGFGNSDGADHASDDQLARFDFANEKFLVNGEIEGASLDINGNADIAGVTLLQASTGGNSATTLIPLDSSGNSQLKIKGGNYIHSVAFETSWNDFEYAKLTGGYNTGDSHFNINKSDASGAIDATTRISTGDSFFAGNVGIGTTSPSQPLHIDLGTVDVKAQLDAIGGFDGMLVDGTNASYNLIGGNGDKYSLGALNDGSFRIYNEGGAGYALTLNNSGKVGIGTTSPGEKLEVAGNIKLTGNLNVGGYISPNDEGGNLSIFGGNDTTSDAQILLHGNGNYWGSLELNYGYDAVNSFLKISQGANEHLRITNGGNVGIGTTSPSAKLQVIETSGYVLKTNGDIALTTYTGDTKIDMANNSLQLLSPSGNVQIGDAESDGNGTSIQVDDANSKVVIAGNVGIGATTPDSLLHIEKTDTAYDVARGIHVEYTKNHTNTTGWGASLFGVRSNVYNDGVGKLTDLQAGRFVSEHIGTGISYYLLGSQSKGVHNGSGNTGVIWGAFNAGQVLGTGTGTHPFLIGTNQKAELDNANATVGNMAGIVVGAKTTAGTVTGRIDAAWLELDCNQGAATTVDANILYLKSDTGNLTVSGTARSIYSNSTLPSEFLGSIQAPTFNLGSEDNYLRENSGDVELYGDAAIVITSGDGMSIEMSDVIDITGGGNLVSDGSISGAAIIKNGGTSSQFLKADGSVDSTVYTGDQDLSGYVTTSTTQTISGAKLFNNDVALNQTDLLDVATGYFSQISIGATSPTALFHIIDNSEQSKVRIGSDTSNYLSIDVAGDGDSVISAVGSGFLPPDINFNTNSTTVLKINGTLGYVGIGTVTPSERLEVNGNVQAETLIATDITDGYVPYSQSGTLGLQDSEIYQSGTGRVGIGTTTLSQALNVNGDVLATGYRVSAMQTAPSSRSDTGTLGEIRITADYIYVCYATDSWRRVAISAW